jgi:hypothetical protein
MYSVPGTWQVPAKEVVRVLGIFCRDIGPSFAYHPALCLWRWAYKDVLLLGQMSSESLVGNDTFGHGRRSGTSLPPRLTSLRNASETQTTGLAVRVRGTKIWLRRGAKVRVSVTLL